MRSCVLCPDIPVASYVQPDNNWCRLLVFLILCFEQKHATMNTFRHKGSAMKLQLHGGKKACAIVCYVSDLLLWEKIYMYEPVFDGKAPRRSCNFTAEKGTILLPCLLRSSKHVHITFSDNWNAVFQVTLLPVPGDFLFPTCVSKHIVSPMCF